MKKILGASRQGWLACAALLLGACSKAVSQPAPLPPPEAPPTPPTSVAATSVALDAPETVPLRSRPQLAARDIPEIDRLMAQALAERKLPGAVVVVGRRDGVVFQRAYGQRAVIPAPLPMTEDTIFDQASLTKPIVTATLIQHLIEQGRLNLDDRVAKYVPEFGARGKQNISVRQLLLHTAGLPIVNPLGDYAEGPAQGLAHVFDARLEFAPGERYHYGDLGYIVLGVLIERIAGEPLDRLAQRVIFEPLGMRETGYKPSRALLSRIAPTELAEERPIPLIHGDVHDPRAHLLGGVAGNAGVFSTAADIARFARFMLGDGELEGVRVLSRASVQELTRPVRLPGAVRSAGWDVQSSYSKPRGRYLTARAFGHGGYTGTSLWIDPELDLFISFSSNRVHPNGDGNVISLLAAIADAAVLALEPAPKACADPPPPIRTGIDVLRARNFEGLRGQRVALVTHRAAAALDGTPTLDVLKQAPGVALVAILSPEHGLSARGEGAIADSRDVATALPVYSLYGQTTRPTKAMLDNVDVIVVDLVDVGTRYYTYMSTLHQVLVAGAEHHIPVMVLDRPNPIGGVVVEGPLLDKGYENFVNHHRLPVRHGMTAGELSELINDERHIGARLEVVAVEGWRREALLDETGLPWLAPSPNLRDLEAAFLYPAIGLLESTNVSVGRGTDRPFHIIGAPFIDGQALLGDMQRAQLPGVEFTLAEFVPEADPQRGKRCHGISARVTDARTFQPVRTGMTLARAIWRQRPAQWHSHKLMRLIGNRAVVDALFAGASVAELERLWRPDLEAFLQRRATFLRYPQCSPVPEAPADELRAGR